MSSVPTGRMGLAQTGLLPSEACPTAGHPAVGRATDTGAFLWSLRESTQRRAARAGVRDRGVEQAARLFLPILGLGSDRAGEGSSHRLRSPTLASALLRRAPRVVGSPTPPT